MEPVKINPLRQQTKVRYSETDHTGRMKVSAILLLMQDLATEHAAQYRFGFYDLEKMNKTWVLSRIRLQMNSFPQKEDELSAITWPRGIDRVFALRDFKFFNATGHEIGCATTSWLVIEKDTHRPHLPTILDQQIYPDIEPAFAENAVRLSAKGDKFFAHKRVACFSDIDINQHVNNTRYIDWIFDTLSESEYQFKSLDFTINFNAEVKRNDEIDFYRSAPESKIIEVEGRNGAVNIVTTQIKLGGRSG